MRKGDNNNYWESVEMVHRVTFIQKTGCTLVSVHVNHHLSKPLWLVSGLLQGSIFDSINSLIF